ATRLREKRRINMNSRNRLLTLMLIILITIFAESPDAHSEFEAMPARSGMLSSDLYTLPIVKDKEAAAIVVIHENDVDDSDNQFMFDTAQILVEYVEKSTGVELEIRTRAELQADGDQFAEHTRIHIGFVEEEQAQY